MPPSPPPLTHMSMTAVFQVMRDAKERTSSISTYRGGGINIHIQVGGEGG